MFLTVLAQTAREKCDLKPDLPVLVGVSGGVDSLALMYGLHALGYTLVVAHLDHALRLDSAQDADFVQAAADSLGLPFVRTRVDVRQAAALEGQSLEEAAREVRYAFLFKQARAFQAQAVAVAHQADDQVETVLMHFLRGAALSGLSGMAYRKRMPVWDAEIPLVRPLLNVWREEIERFIAEQGLQPRFDQSNLDRTYFRNRLRHELIPTLETYNSQFRQALHRTVAVLSEEDAFLDGLAQRGWDACFRSKTADRVVLQRTAFLQQQKAIQRRLLRQAIALLRPNLRDVGFDAVERGLAFIAEPSERGSVDLVARLDLAVLDEMVIVKTWDAELPDGNQALLVDADVVMALPLGGSVPLRHGWRLQAAALLATPEKAQAQAAARPEREVWLDADQLTFPLTVRGWREGERWQPLGLTGHSQKLSDFFINEKVKAHLRGIWPLVCSGDQIVWVAGLRPAENARVSEETKRIVQLRLVRLVAEG